LPQLLGLELPELAGETGNKVRGDTFFHDLQGATLRSGSIVVRCLGSLVGTPRCGSFVMDGGPREGETDKDRFVDVCTLGMKIFFGLQSMLRAVVAVFLDLTS
jgi:hypothetical protein